MKRTHTNWSDNSKHSLWLIRRKKLQIDVSLGELFRFVAYWTMIPIFSPRSRFFIGQIQIFHFNWVAGLYMVDYFVSNKNIIEQSWVIGLIAIIYLWSIKLDFANQMMVFSLLKPWLWMTLHHPLADGLLFFPFSYVNQYATHFIFLHLDLVFSWFRPIDLCHTAAVSGTMKLVFHIFSRFKFSMEHVFHSAADTGGMA